MSSTETSGRAVGDLLTGAEALVRLLRNRVSTVFAYPGTSELALCDAVLRDGTVDLVNARGDREAVFMAGGGNRVSSRSCAALVHGARGLTNALGAVADLRRSEVPVLCLVGMASTGSARFLPPHAEPGLIAAAGSFARAAYDCSRLTYPDPRGFVATVRSAIEALDRTPAGPVLLGIPQDMLAEAFVPASVLADPGGEPEPEPDLDAALELLMSARRPVVFVDDYLLNDDRRAGESLGAFAHRLGAPVLQVDYRRGPMLFPRLHRNQVPTLVGAYRPQAVAHRSVVHGADLLITVEDRNMYPRVVGPLGHARKMAITGNLEATSKNGYLCDRDLVVHGRPTDILDRLAAGLKPGNLWLDPARLAVQPEEPASRGGFEVVAALGRALAMRTAPALFDDSQMFGGLIARHYDLLPPDVRVYGSHGGFVGHGLPTAAGAAIAHPDQTVLAVLGDQGFTNAFQGLASTADRAAPLVVLVCNNGSSVSLRKQMRHDGLSPATARFLGNANQLDYAAMARAAGFATTVVAGPADGGSDEQWRMTADSLQLALVRAFDIRAPHLVELTLPADPDFWSGVWEVAGAEPANVPAMAGRGALG